MRIPSALYPVLLACLVAAGCGEPGADQAALVATGPATVAPAPVPSSRPAAMPVPGAPSVLRAALDATHDLPRPTPTPSSTPEASTPGPGRSGAGGGGGGGATGPAGRTVNTEVTFYGAYDNDPPGSAAIAYPVAHSEAGGTGTYADPITFAADPDYLAVGTIVYYAPLRKYFVMEDLCAPCRDEYQANGHPHIDFYTGGYDSGVSACQSALTPSGLVAVEVSPPPGRAVDATPLYSNGRCISG
ncbi:hypothetical protein ACL02T_25395 [Pseudonocardia sp. RS010]|uniref:hypothetical protein n=1 Tax=Pseudonocardia sp. RS010 TaxID=3385979 RepID=UPI00399FEB7B